MAKLEDVDVADHPGLAEKFAQVEASRGWVSNLMRTVAHTPDGLQHYARLGHFARYETDLSEVQRELAVCTTVRGVEYGWIHHSGLARQIGVSDAQLAAIKAGEVPGDLAAPERALVAFVLEFASFGGVAQPTLDALRAHFSARQVMDIAMISAYYLAAGSIIVGFDLPIEGPETLQIELDWQTGRPGA